MTVKELIRVLQAFPKASEIVVEVSDSEYGLKATGIRAITCHNNGVVTLHATENENG